MKNILDVRLRRRHAFLAAVLLFFLLSIADLTTTSQLRLFPLYLVPVLLSTWYLGPAWGVGFSLAATVVSMSVGIFIAHPYSHSSFFYFDVIGQFLSLLIFLWVVQIASQLHGAATREASRARTDFLTGIANRTAFFEALGQETERHERYRRSFALISLDCDNFKHINDKFGHATGDRLLHTVAQTLASNVRRTDLAARLGGDEFMVLVPETDTSHAAAVGKHLNEELTHAMKANHWPVTFSIGIAIFEDTPRSPEFAVEFADSLMYRAKHAGKNRTVLAAFRDDGATTSDEPTVG